MSAVRVDIPEETLACLKTDAESFGRDLKVLAAVKLFELGKLSSGRAAQLAGMSRVLLRLRSYQVAPLQTTPEELRQDILHA